MKGEKFDLALCMRQAEDKVRLEKWYGRPWKELRVENGGILKVMEKTIEEVAMTTRKPRKQKVVHNHRLLWNKVAEILETDKTAIKLDADMLKVRAFREIWGYEEPYPRLGCFCCEYTHTNGSSCKSCPVIWGGELDIRCFDDEGEFHNWCNAFEKDKDSELSAEIARKIAELPERE